MANSFGPDAARLTLFCQCSRGDRPSTWQFRVCDERGNAVLSAADEEPGVWGSRLELLTLVRGLEAIDRPSRVTVYIKSDYIHHGIRHGLPYWRETDWQWESFGQWTPIKNADLWQRLDRALNCHQVTFENRRFDRPHDYSTVVRPAHAFSLSRSLKSTHWLGWVGSAIRARLAELKRVARGWWRIASRRFHRHRPLPIGQWITLFEWEPIGAGQGREAA